MSIDVQEILQTLLHDKSQLNGLKSQTKLYLLRRKVSILNAPIPKVADQKRRIALFLETILQVFQSEDLLSLSGIDDVEEMLDKMPSLDASKPKGERILEALLDEQFKTKFFALFDKKISSERLPQPYYIFPTISANPEKLESLIQFCVIHKEDDFQANIESEESSSEISSEQSSEESETKTTAHSSSSCSPISMIVLGGFIAALGIAAVVVGLILLTSGTGAGLALAFVGFSAFIGGGTTSCVGFFRRHPFSDKDSESLPHSPTF